MAITRSQIARQLLAEGGVSLDDAKRMAPEGEFLAYINPKEAQMLKDAGGSGIMTPMGIPSFVDFGGSGTGYGSAADTFSAASGNPGADSRSDFGGGDGGGNDPIQDQIQSRPAPKKSFFQTVSDVGKNIAGLSIFGPAYTGFQLAKRINPDFFKFNPNAKPPVTPPGTDDNETQVVQPIMPMMPMVPKLPTDIEPEKSDMAEFQQRFILPERFRLAEGGDVKRRKKGQPADEVMEEDEEEIFLDKMPRPRRREILEAAEGGQVSVKDAEKMAPKGEFLAYINDDEAALLKSLGGAGKAVNETGIPSFFVKKLFKKAAKAVKKVVKSPIGKAALAGAAIYGLGGGTFMGRTLPTFGSLPLQSSAAGPGGFGFGNILTNVGRLTGLGSGGLDLGTKFSGLSKGKKALAGIAGASLLGGLAAGAGGEDDESLDDVVGRISDQTGIDVQQIRKEVQDAYAKGDLSSLASKYPFLVPKGSAMADGGIARLNYGSGGLSNYSKDIVDEYKANVKEGYKGSIRKYILEFYGPEYLKPMADGGIARLGYADGETVLDISDVNLDSKMKAARKLSEETGMPIEKALEKIMADAFAEGVSIKRIKEEMMLPKRKPPEEVQKRKEKNFKKAKPALEKESADMVEDLIRSKKAGGGLMDLGGNEMDLRGGGFVPIGAKEKADDVPARLSKNEFVFTADAVRAAGGGSVEKGAQKMYNTMKQLEDSIA